MAPKRSRSRALNVDVAPAAPAAHRITKKSKIDLTDHQQTLLDPAVSDWAKPKRKTLKHRSGMSGWATWRSKQTVEAATQTETHTAEAAAQTATLSPIHL